MARVTGLNQIDVWVLIEVQLQSSWYLISVEVYYPFMASAFGMSATQPILGWL